MLKNEQNSILKLLTLESCFQTYEEGTSDIFWINNSYSLILPTMYFLFYL